MATLEMVNACTEHNKRIGRFRYEKGKKVQTPDLIALGIKSVVSVNEAVKISKSEKRLHEREDSVLRFLYIEN